MKLKIILSTLFKKLELVGSMPLPLFFYPSCVLVLQDNVAYDCIHDKNPSCVLVLQDNVPYDCVHEKKLNLPQLYINLKM